MPEREFELYLSLLSRFLRLRPAQRDEVADELRDHLDQRLEELAARGLSREEAIHQALDEFGDAAELAKHFTQAAHVRRRRLIMRCTYGTIAALAASLFIATAFWPASPPSPVVRKAVAQDSGRATPPAREVANSSTESDERAEIEAKLSKRLGVVDWGEITLADALEKLSDEIGVDIVIDHGTLIDEGVALENPIRRMHVKHARLEARALLDLILESVQLGYYIRDGVLIVTTTTKLAATIEVQIYNIRDLPATIPPVAAAATATRRPALRGFAAIDTLPAANASADSAVVIEIGSASPLSVRLPQDKGAVQVLRQGFGTAPAGGGAAPPEPAKAAAPFMKRSNLAEVIMECVGPDAWDDNGGPGKIAECTQFDGLLFVRADPVVQGQVKRLLRDLRAVLRDQAAGAGVARPKN